MFEVGILPRHYAYERGFRYIHGDAIGRQRLTTPPAMHQDEVLVCVWSLSAEEECLTVCESDADIADCYKKQWDGPRSDKSQTWYVTTREAVEAARAATLR